jgi:hypothetical protein
MKLSKLRAETMERKVAGTSIPRQDRTSKAFAAAQKVAKKAGFAGEEKEIGEIEGGVAKPRLDRPGRKAGGRVDANCYADGGAIKPGFIKHPGSLRKALKVPEGENIPEKKLESAEHSDNSKLRKRAILAETMRGWKKG